MAIEHAVVGASHIRMVVRRYVRLLRILRGVLRFDWHLCVNGSIEVRVRVQWGIRMALVRIVGVWEQDSWSLLLVVVVVGRLNRRDAIHYSALKSLGLLHSLRLSHSWFHLLLYSQVVILRLQHFDVCIRCQRQRCRSTVWLVILSRCGYMHRIADRGALRVYRQNLLLTPNLSTTTLSKRVTLPLVPSDGRWNRAEQLSFRFRLDIHEPDVPGLKVVVGRGVAWTRCDDPPNGGGRCRRE